MKFVILVALLACLAFVAFARSVAKPQQGSVASYEDCLLKCKHELPKRSVPTSCFAQCKKPALVPTKKVSKHLKQNSYRCKIPIMKLQCKAQPTVPVNTTIMADSETDSFDLPVTAEGLWEAYHTELLKFITKGNAAAMSSGQFNGLQLVSTPIPAEWYDNDAAFQMLAARSSKFQGTYEPTMQNFDTSYCEDFVPNLNFALGANPQGEATIKRLYQEQDDLTRDMMEEEFKCEDRFNALSATIRRIRYGNSFDKYAKLSCSTLNSLLEKSTVLKGKIENTYNLFSGGRKEMEARTAVLKCKNTKRDFIEMNPLKDFMNNVNNGRMNPFSVEITRTSTSSTAKSSFKTMGLNIVVVSFSMNKAMRSLTTTMRDFRLHISAKSFGAIHTAPNPTWFNGDVISQWRNGPFRNGKSSASFFGQGGSISLLPKTYYVVYQPTVEFSLNKKDADEFEKQSSFSISLSISFVSLSFGKSSKVSKFKESESLYRIRIEDNSPTPQVIAVNNIVL